MNTNFFRFRRFWIVAAVLIVVGTAGVALAFVPNARAWANYAAIRVGLRNPPAQPKSDGHDHEGHDHAGHNRDQSDGHDHGKEHPSHDHPGHDEASSVELSQQAEGNIGLKTLTVQLGSFDRSISVPGMVIERPGRSVLRVTAPLTGVVTKIYPIQGEAVTPGQPLFELRLTHEELVQVQSDLLRLLGELDVVKREVTRLMQVTESGAVATKVLLERQYEQHKLEANIEAQRQTLVLHGLSAEQADAIINQRTLLRGLTVTAPAAPQNGMEASDRLLQIQALTAEQGQHVTAGDPLCTLVDHSELYIEGTAFEGDAQAL
ncbi:MAG: efflux RND transporter periplasmic adaptor subunit, partial [Planctomycetes bacterium]|nr:efflux RND transporter periplasmic adaptor subunit [Planctomycetota bacterium]